METTTAKVLAIITEKGGVAKTTTAVTLACGLAANGRRVLLVDTDEQGHVAGALGYDKEPCLFDLLQRNARWETALRAVPAEQYLPAGNYHTSTLAYLPGNIDTMALPFVLHDHQDRLALRLAEVAGAFEFIIIDTGPAASKMHTMVYLAADYVIHPTRLENLSFDGLMEAITHRERANAMRRGLITPKPEIVTLGILPTFYKRATLEHTENLRLLREQFGELVWPPVADRILWAEALAGASGYRPVYAHAPESTAAKEARAYIHRVEERLANHVVTA